MADTSHPLRDTFRKFALPLSLAMTTVIGMNASGHGDLLKETPSTSSDTENAEGPIRDVQEFLRDQGYRYVNATNRMDVHTATALIHFKQAHDILPADDSVNADTLALLTASLAGTGPIPDAHFDPRLESIRVLTGEADTAYVRLVTHTANRYIQRGVDPNVVLAILKASQDTNTDFQYLMGIADAESSLICNNEPSTSTAQGCFGVLEPMERLAKNAGWIPEEADPRDPYYGAVVAAEMARENYRIIRTVYNGPIGPPELKAAHFLGGSEIQPFMRLLASNPSANAAARFPEAAAANRSMFYRNGRGVTVRQLYAQFQRKMQAVPSYIANPPDIRMAIIDRSNGRPRSPGNNRGGRPAS